MSLQKKSDMAHLNLCLTDLLTPPLKVICLKTVILLEELNKNLKVFGWKIHLYPESCMVVM